MQAANGEVDRQTPWTTKIADITMMKSRRGDSQSKMAPWRLMVGFCLILSVVLVVYEQTTLLATTMVASDSAILSFDPIKSSLRKLRKQLTPQQEERFRRSNPIYIDIGLNDGKDTALYLSKGYSVVSVDAFPAWVNKAKEEHAKEMADGRFLAFNVGLAIEEAESMPLYYKEEGSVVASFVKEKGCSGWRQGAKCFEHNVQVVRCESLIQLIDARADIMKVDIEMLHHACVRSLSRLETRLLPKHVCWEEHDKAFGPGRVMRPITDAKLILGLSEAGYNQVKIIMQGPNASKYYKVEKNVTGHGSGSGVLHPDEMSHYRSHETNKDGEFDTRWMSVEQIFTEGLFGPAKVKPLHFTNPRGGTYYDVCMKLNPAAETTRPLLEHPDSFPLASYASK
jgi:FkbM family methyltransferase